MLSLILLVFALVLFLLAAFVNPLPDPSPTRLRLACFGLACLAGAELFARAAAAHLLG